MKTAFKFVVLFAVAAVARSVGQDAKSAAIAVVVAKSAAISQVTAGDLLKYFRADKTRLPDGTKIVLVAQDVGRPERAAVLKYVYRMSEHEYVDYFVSATFTGAVASAPKNLPSAAAVLKFVVETPGAVGYVRAADVDDRVKVLLIDGKSPADAGYLIPAL